MGGYKRTLARAVTATVVFLTTTTAFAFPINNDPEAIDVLGQADYVTGFADPSSDPVFGAASTATNRFFVSGDVAYDTDARILYAADVHNYRVLRFDLADGLTLNEAAIGVLGQTDFFTGGVNPIGANTNSQNPAEGCTTEINACGLHRVDALALDQANQRLYVSDPDNNRILVWDLNSFSDGKAASFVLGQADFTTKDEDQACGGGSFGTVNECGMHFPTQMHYDPAGTRLFVADSNNNRVLVFETENLANGMPATAVLGQPDFTSRDAGMACNGGATGVTDACSMNNPNAVSFDAVKGRLFVGDENHHRVTIFNLSSGVTNGMAASLVLGQPDFTTSTVNTSCDGATNGDTNTNACGLGVFGVSTDFYAADSRLYVGDSSNHRVLVFDTDALTNGVAATGVIGQADFSTGFANDPFFGGATSRSRMVAPLGVAFDPVGDRLFVSDAGNHRVLVFGSNVGGVPIETGDDDGNTVTTMDAAGNTVVDVQNNDGQYGVIFPPGTQAPGTDSEITVEPFLWPNLDYPAIQINAELPAGATKTLTIPNHSSVRTCIVDRDSPFTYLIELSGNFTCTVGGQRHDVATPAVGVCSTVSTPGDPGDNPNDPSDPAGMHDVEICNNGDTVTVNGLNNSLVITMASSENPSASDLEVGGGGCNTGAPANGLPLMLLGLMALLSRRRPEAQR